MAPCLINLRPDNRLNENNFEGYKLSLAQVSIEKFPVNPSHFANPPHLYSLAHARLFSLHNHLHWDNYDHSGVYFIDKQAHVQKLAFEENANLEDTFEIPAATCPDRHNLSLAFCSSNLALISDGAGTLYVVRTGNRKVASKWKSLFECRPSESGEPFVIADAKLEESPGGDKIHCLLHRVQHLEDGFQTVLEWIVLTDNFGAWSLQSRKKLQGKGSAHYCALEPGCDAVYLISDYPFAFVLSLENAVSAEDAVEDEKKKLIYTWLQTGEDVTLTLQLGVGIDRSKLQIKTTKESISIEYNHKPLLQGTLHNIVDEELTTWNVASNGQLDVLLTKSSSGLMWQNFLKDGDLEGEQIMDPTLVQEIHNRLAHLCSETEADAEGTLQGFSNQQLEECDAITEENTTLVRIDYHTHKTSHVIPLSIHQVILTSQLEGDKAPAIGFRHDVDACVWQPEKLTGDVWPVRHEATLPAFGYVQSSKQNKKYCVCSPDFKYSVVCEANRHIFIYKRQSANSQGCQLRQRTGVGEDKKVKYGEQLVQSIEDGEVFGIYASNKCLYVLTENNLIVFHSF